MVTQKLVELLSRVRFPLAAPLIGQETIPRFAKINKLVYTNIMVEEIKKPKIFVIEDDVFMVELLGNELKNAGLETYSYQTGQTAIDAYAQLQPDLIVLDLLLPDKNGFEVLREIRRLPNGVKVKVMVLSNMAEDADKEEAKRLGVQEYLVKANYSLPEILGKIQVLLLSAVL